MSDRFDPDPRAYPQTWFLLDMVDREPRLLGQEVVDLSPGAIELRHAARSLRAYAEQQERWLPLRPEPAAGRLEASHRRDLSFGPALGYCVEHDASRRIHGGRPFRHLLLRFRGRVLTPATSAEIGLYFYGRRPAVFGVPEPGAVHGYIGMDWRPLESEDVRWLVRREMKDGS